MQFDHYWRLMLAKQPAAVLVNVNKCYTSRLANFLDVFQLIVSLFWTSTSQHTHTQTHTMNLSLCMHRRRICKLNSLLLWISGLMRSVLWKIWCLHHGGVWVHYVNAFVFGTIPNFAEACDSSWKLGCVFSVCACYFVPCVWDPAIRKPYQLGSDLLFFTSPTYQPPASVAVKRNGWYFRGELLFPFLASIFYFNVWVSASSDVEQECSKFRPS